MFVKLNWWKNTERKILCRIDEVLVQENDMDQVPISPRIPAEPQIVFSSSSFFVFCLCFFLSSFLLLKSFSFSSVFSGVEH